MPKREGAEERRFNEQIYELAKKGANYVRLKKDETKLKKEIKTENEDIKKIVKENPSLYELNGKHKEVTAPLGDGVNEIFIQIQTRESISTVDNIVDLVKQKLGDKADNFIMQIEVLHSNALEAMLNQGLITEQDILDWTTTRETESLIVKANKIKK